MKYLLDTNICIYIIKRKPAHVLARFQAETIGDIGISSITVAEMQYGIAKSQFPERNREALEKFLTPLLILDFDMGAALAYGELRVFLEKQGTPIGAYDLLLAAQAKALDIILVTNNLHEFERIPGLKVENWVGA
jgi:tRNA(fMet)-specific endonuclease VapC